MQAAQALAGYTLGGADLLRRAMGKKIQSEMDAQREMFIKGAMEHSQVPEDRASYIFDQIDKFAGYGFNKSHAAAYALIAYWTAWLKANYPVQFMAASMTLDMQNTDKLAIFKQELDRMQVQLLPPDINQSAVEFAVEGDAIRYALAALKGVGEGAMQALVATRKAGGPFRDLYDIAARVDAGVMNKRQFEQLAASGAFDSLNPNRAQVYAAAEMMLRHAQSLAAEKKSGQSSLFGGAAETLAAPPMPTVNKWDPLETLRQEFDAVGFYLSAHPLDARTQQLEKMKVMTHAAITERMGSRSSDQADMAGVLLKKQIRVSPKTGNKYAFLQMSDATGVFEGMVFSETLARVKDQLVEGESFFLRVAVDQKEEGQLRFTIQDIDLLDTKLAGRIRRVEIGMTGEKALSNLQEILKVEGAGAAQIFVTVPVRDGLTAELKLPGKWNFSAAARNALLRIDGVTGVTEQ